MKTSKVIVTIDKINSKGGHDLNITFLSKTDSISPINIDKYNELDFDFNFLIHHNSNIPVNKRKRFIPITILSALETTDGIYEIITYLQIIENIADTHKDLGYVCRLLVLYFSLRPKQSEISELDFNENQLLNYIENKFEEKVGITIDKAEAKSNIFVGSLAA